MPAMMERLPIIPAARIGNSRFICGSPKPYVPLSIGCPAGSLLARHHMLNAPCLVMLNAPCLDCHTVADHRQSVAVVLMLLAGRIRIGHATQGQRELAGALRSREGFRLGWRNFQGGIDSVHDLLPIFRLDILADRENTNIGQNRLADE